MNNRGISSLGLCHPKYQANELIRCFQSRNEIVFCWLDLFFNPKDSKKVVKVMRQSKNKIAVVHIINGPGINNTRTQPHEISYKETTKSLEKKILEKNPVFMQKFRKRLQHVKAVCDKAPPGTLRLIISPWLERQQIQKKAFEILVSEINIIFDSTEYFTDICDNPVQGNPFPGYLSSKHGATPPKNTDITDLDGEDFESIDLRQYGKDYENSFLCFVWGVKDNGHKPKEEWKPPQNRVNFTGSREWPMYKAWVSDEALEPTSPLNPIDTQGKQKHPAPDGKKKGFTWKLGEEKKYGTSLMPANFQQLFHKVEIRKNGKILDTGKFRGKYLHDGSNRMIYDFKKHITAHPDNSVLVADEHCWALEKPCFRID